MNPQSFWFNFNYRPFSWPNKGFPSPKVAILLIVTSWLENTSPLCTPLYHLAYGLTYFSLCGFTLPFPLWASISRFKYVPCIVEHTFVENTSLNVLENLLKFKNAIVAVKEVRGAPKYLGDNPGQKFLYKILHQSIKCWQNLTYRWKLWAAGEN